MSARYLWIGVVAVLSAGIACVPGPSTTSASASTHYKVEHTDAEWRKLLSPEAYDVLRQAGTERPFTSPLLNEHRSGVFTCAGCGTKLFESKTKFDSGTGWPSFYQPIKGSVIERPDPDGERTEVVCATCGGHLGHVFDDGPKPTGLRYCMNGAALKFEPAAKK